MRLLDPLIDLLYPPACWACGAALEDARQGLCAACPLPPLGASCRRCAEPRREGEADPPDCPNCRGRDLAFRHVQALGRYEGALQRAILRAKFGGETAAWGWLGSRLGGAAAAAPWAGEVRAVVPVPSARAARWRRGFNPARLLASGVAKTLNAPVKDLLRRRGPDAPQVGLGRAERLANVSAAFCLTRGARPSGKGILLVDDVMTTGSTVAACAAALRSAGAASVDVAVLAR